MNGYNRILNRNGSNFFSKKNEIDDETFNMWKTELEKELPSFWEDIREKP